MVRRAPLLLLAGVALLVGLFAALPSAAQRAEAPKLPKTPWANKLFLPNILNDDAMAVKEAPVAVEHDFGTVPSGTLCSHTFTFTNIYSVPLQVIDVRTECGCLKAYPPNRVLAPYEQAEFTVTLNAAAFKGAVTKKLLVTVGPNFYSTAEVRLKANSREDVAVTPGQIDFGVVPQGTKATKAVTIRYTGREKNWKVLGGAAGSDAYDVEVKEAARGFLSTDYAVNVTLKDAADAGPIADTVTLRTNDPVSPLVTVALGGTVVPPVSASPARVEFRDVKVGETATAKVLVRAKADCSVAGPKDDGDGVTVETFDGTRQLHVVTVKYEPKADGALKKTIRVRTNLPGSPEATILLDAK